MTTLFNKIFRRKRDLLDHDDTGINDIKNLDDLLKILSFIIMADNDFSEEESKFIRDYFNQLYPEFVEDIEKRIDNYISTYATFSEIENEGIPERLSNSLDLDEKLTLLVTLFTLIDVDGIDEAEIVAIQKVAHALGISDDDFDFVYFMHDAKTLKGIDTAQLSRNMLQFAESKDADIYLPGLGEASLTFYKLEDLYYLKLVSPGPEQLPVSLNNFKLPTKMVALFTPDSKLVFHNVVLDLDDVKQFMKNKNTGFTKKVLLRFEENRMLFCDESDAQYDIQVGVEKNRIVVTVRGDLSVQMRGKPLQKDSSYLANFFDDLLINERVRLNIRRLLVQEDGEDVVRQRELIDKKYRITNYDRGADYYINDRLDDEIEIEISEKDQKYYCTVIESPFTIFVDDVPVKDTIRLRRHGRITVGKTVLKWSKKNRNVEQLSTDIREVLIRDLRFSIRDKLLIDDVSFELNIGDMVSVIGPSGSGKSTLLSLLCGYYRPSEGEIRYNGYELTKNIDSLKSYIGFVPQDDLLYENLSVYENMYYRARIVNPYLSDEETNESIDNLLLEFGLYEVKNLKVGSPVDKTLSGGQRKRLNIALEILNDPDVLYLDEPTSGLSSKDSEMIIQYLRRLSDKGKIIVSTIHQPSAKIFGLFNKLLLLDKGGKLAYFGTTAHGIDFFQDHSQFHSEEEECPLCRKKNPEILLSVMEEPLIDLQGRIVTRENDEGIPIPLRKYPPDYWKRLYHRMRDKVSRFDAGRDDEVKYEDSEGLESTKTVSLLKQFNSVFSRNIKNKLKSKTFVKLILLQSPLLAVFLAWILRFKTIDADLYSIGSNHFIPYFIFLSIISILFISFSNSIDEIVAERSILFREKMLNIKNWIFYSSKFISLTIISIFQVIIFCIISFPILDIEWILFPWYFLVLFLVALNGISIGLAISAFVKSSVSNIIPLILIPQIILGGALIPFKDLTGTDLTPVYSHILTSKWGYEALVIAQAQKNKYTSIERWANEPSDERYERREKLQEYWKSLEDQNLKREDVINEASEELVDNAKTKIKDNNNIFLADKCNVFGIKIGTIAINIAVLSFFSLLMILMALFVMKWKDKKV